MISRRDGFRIFVRLRKKLDAGWNLDSFQRFLMASSGTYNFLPSVGELVLNSYARIQMRRPSLTTEHFADARMEANLLQVEWSNRGVTLWTVDLQSITLVENVVTYDVPSTTITILDAYARTAVGGQNTDRYLMPISRTEYASFPNKTASPGPPITYWYDRLISPTVTIWPPPDGQGPYTFNYYRYRQIQDANIPSGITPELPYRFLDACAAGLSCRLARMHKPEMLGETKQEAERTFSIAATQDTEGTPFYIIPGISSYYRT